MKTPRLRVQSFLPAAVLLGMTLLVSVSPRAQAAEPKAGEDEKRVAAGKCYTSAGGLLRREAANKPWTLVDSLDTVNTKDQLVVLPGGRSVIGSKNDAVRMTLIGNLPQLYPIPNLESAVVLHANPDLDLDVTLERGGVKFTNRKEKGAARVRIRLPGATWELSLAAPGDECAAEVSSRWSTGVPFTRDEKSKEAPISTAIVLVLKGNVDLKVGFNSFSLRAPPGPALYQWDSDSDAPVLPARMEKFPEWMETKGPNSKEAKRAREIIEQVADGIKANGVEKALSNLMAASNKEMDKERAVEMREIAVFSMGAVDDLNGVTDALNHASADVRDFAVAALREWIGRGPKQDLVLYQYLVKDKKYSEGQADIVLQLLHSFSDLELSRTETYETLIRYLNHDKLPIRELAWWHLVRLVPNGSKIPYDAAAPAEERQKGYEAWKKMLDDKKLPPTGKPSEK